MITVEYFSRMTVKPLALTRLASDIPLHESMYACSFHVPRVIDRKDLAPWTPRVLPLSLSLSLSLSLFLLTWKTVIPRRRPHRHCRLCICRQGLSSKAYRQVSRRRHVSSGWSQIHSRRQRRPWYLVHRPRLVECCCSSPWKRLCRPR
jgi:hypothetical protein